MIATIPQFFTVLAVLGSVALGAPKIVDASGTPLTEGAPVLRQGSQTMRYIIPADMPSVRSGALAVIRERIYPSDFPASRIPRGVELYLGEGFGDTSLSTSFEFYQRYHSQNVVDPKLRNRFHRRFGANQRTDEPIDTRRSLFRFHGQDQAQRSVLLLRYTRTEGTETSLKFHLGFDGNESEIKITVIDLGDGTQPPVQSTLSLSPKHGGG